MATWTFIANYIVTQEEKEALMNTFRALDLNSDGFISREELLIGFKKIMCQSEAEE